MPRRQQQHRQVDLLRAAVAVWAETPEVRRTVTCQGVGCFGCCRGDPQVVLDEADRILRCLTPEVKQRVLQFQSGKGAAALCPLLVQGRCSVYAERPLACRMYHSASPPLHCYPEAAGHQRIRVVVPPAEGLGGMIATLVERGGRRTLLSELKRALAQEKG